jgi:hypothetical protein
VNAVPGGVTTACNKACNKLRSLLACCLPMQGWLSAVSNQYKGPCGTDEHTKRNHGIGHQSGRLTNPRPTSS